MGHRLQPLSISHFLEYFFCFPIPADRHSPGLSLQRLSTLFGPYCSSPSFLSSNQWKNEYVFRAHSLLFPSSNCSLGPAPMHHRRTAHLSCACRRPAMTIRRELPPSLKLIASSSPLSVPWSRRQSDSFLVFPSVAFFFFFFFFFLVNHVGPRSAF